MVSHFRQALWKWNADEAYAKWGTRTRRFVGVWGACRRAYGGELPRRGLWKWKPDEVLREVERGVARRGFAERQTRAKACHGVGLHLRRAFQGGLAKDEARGGLSLPGAVSHFRLGVVSHFRLAVDEALCGTSGVPVGVAFGVPRQALWKRN